MNPHDEVYRGRPAPVDWDAAEDGQVDRRIHGAFNPYVYFDGDAFMCNAISAVTALGFRWGRNANSGTYYIIYECGMYEASTLARALCKAMDAREAAKVKELPELPLSPCGDRWVLTRDENGGLVAHYSMDDDTWTTKEQAEAWSNFYATVARIMREVESNG
jgi:hypothetical protein